MSKESAVISILERSGWRVKRSGQNLSIGCPLAPYSPLHRSAVDSRPSMGIKVDTESVLVNCFTCGFKAGQLSYLFKRLAYHHASWQPAVDACLEMESAYLEDGLTFLKTQGYMPQPKQVDAQVGETLWTPYARQLHPYWSTRGIADQTVMRWDCGWDQEKGRVLVPVRDHSYRLWGAVGRAVNEGARPKYLNYFDMSKGKHLLGAHVVGEAKSIVIVEGSFDAMRCEQALFNAGLKDDYGVLALMGASMSDDQIRRICSMAHEVILAFDGDEAGQRGQASAYQKINRLLMTRQVHFGALGVKDFGECEEAQIISIIEGADLF